MQRWRVGCVFSADSCHNRLPIAIYTLNVAWHEFRAKCITICCVARRDRNTNTNKFDVFLCIIFVHVCFPFERTSNISLNISLKVSHCTRRKVLHIQTYTISYIVSLICFFFVFLFAYFSECLAGSPNFL